MRKVKLIAMISVSLIVFLTIFALDFPSWQKLDVKKITSGDASSILYDKDGNEIGQVGMSLSARAIKSDEIPLHVKNAFIACEDKRFYSHSGIDIKRILGAVVNNIKSASYQEGGSTITQQLIKLTHLTPDKTISRKANEAYLAMKLERKMTKDEILTAYLNTVYFGSGAYGIENASRIYFGKSADKLTVSESAVLAGIIKAPSAYSPYNNYEKAVERKNYVLSRMEEDGYITRSEMEKAKGEKIRLISENAASDFGWYRDMVLNEAENILNLSADQILSGGFQIYTCLDQDRQRRIEKIFENDALFPSDALSGEKAQSAFIALDSKTGGILCVVGGREYMVKRGLNRATDSRRQPGSALKPLSVYAAAVDGLGLLPTSIVDDTKRTFDGGYTPKNASDSYNGLVTLRDALSRSLNVASVSLIEFTGIEKARDYMKRFRLTVDPDDNGLALALGSMTKGVSPMELTQGYCALSNGGMAVNAHAIRKILDRNNKTVYEFMPSNQRAVSSQSAYILTSMLKTAAQTGSARALRDTPCPIAAKTGTVSFDENQNRDAWTAAYTSEIAASIWMGFDETNKSQSLKETESGSFACRLMAEFMKAETGKEFEKPDSVVELTIDKNALNTQKRVWLAPENAPKALTMTEVFLKNNQPRILSPAFQTPSRPDSPKVYESGNEVIIRFTIKSDQEEYLLFEETEDKKVLIASVYGKTGEEKEIRVPRKSETVIFTMAVRNKIMFDAGVSLVSAESDGVEVYGKRDFRNLFEGFLDGF